MTTAATSAPYAGANASHVRMGHQSSEACTDITFIVRKELICGSDCFFFLQTPVNAMKRLALSIRQPLGSVGWQLGTDLGTSVRLVR